MSSLILDSLEIDNFRTFRHLKIKRLASVNLIVGKNNVGKTSLLEALQLYVRRGSPYLVLDLLEARDEIPHFLRANAGEAEDYDESILAVKHLFYGHPDVTNQPQEIKIGPAAKTNEMLSLSVGWNGHENGENGLNGFDGYEMLDLSSLELLVQFGTHSKAAYPLHKYLRRKRLSRKKNISYVFIPQGGLNNIELEELWDNVTLRDLEKEVIKALRLIAPEVQALNFVKESRHSPERIPKAKIADQDEPIPLRSMGEGMKRLLGITLALVNAKDGMLLIDEVDSGLYHAVLPYIWHLIFEIAHRLNVQVFATTHSWDCIEAFQQAAQEQPNVEGLLFSLRNKRGKPGDVAAVLYDERRLAIATEQQIEVR